MIGVVVKRDFGNKRLYTISRMNSRDHGLYKRHNMKLLSLIITSSLRTTTGGAVAQAGSPVGYSPSADGQNKGLE